MAAVAASAARACSVKYASAAKPRATRAIPAPVLKRAVLNLVKAPVAILVVVAS